jgi:hypothetical protein
MKTVKTFRTEQEAAICSLSLKEIGIYSNVLKNDGGPYPTLTDIYGYSVTVKDEDYQNAIEHIPENISKMPIVEEKIKPESDIIEPVNKKWLLYGGLISGIIIGITLYWIYSSVRFQIHLGIKYYYRNGEMTKAVSDRNKDKQDDYWEYYRDNFTVLIKSDNNFDGKVDNWCNINDNDINIVKIDIDSNGIPDVTNYFDNGVIRKSFIHPNNIKKNKIYREYSILGILENEYIDTDNDREFDMKRNYDSLGNKKIEISIKDTLIDHF